MYGEALWLDEMQYISKTAAARQDDPSVTALLMAARTTIRALALLASLTQAKWIVPGARWIDTKGDVVNAHAGCVTKDPETGKFFFFGEYKTEDQPEGGGVSVYSSDDLATWEPHGKALC